MSWTFNGTDKGTAIASILKSMAENMKEYTGQVKINLEIKFVEDPLFPHKK